MEEKIDFGKVALKVLELIIVKPFTLPFHIYKNALVALSNSKSENSEESVLSSEFPIYIWYVSCFNAVIVLSWFFGALYALYMATQEYRGGFGAFISILIATYFVPLGLGLMRELLSITLKTVLYLKIISKK